MRFFAALSASTSETAARILLFMVDLSSVSSWTVCRFFVSTASFSEGMNAAFSEATAVTPCADFFGCAFAEISSKRSCNASKSNLPSMRKRTVTNWRFELLPYATARFFAAEMSTYTSEESAGSLNDRLDFVTVVVVVVDLSDAVSLDYGRMNSQVSTKSRWIAMSTNPFFTFACRSKIMFTRLD